ncbi:MAG: hypothetical protein ACOCRX_10695 [Candidatus Woesearchaeota archaeon]
MKNKKCKYCGKTFKPNSSSQKFCSKECKTENKKVELVCKFCGEKFKTINKNQIFCSNSCSTKNQMSKADDVKILQEKRRKTILSKNGGRWPSHTEEWKKQMSKKMKGRNITWGDKISKSLIGKPHPNRRINYKHSDDIRKKISENTKKAMNNFDIKKKVSIRTSEAQIGRKLKEETKRKIGKNSRLHMIERIQNSLEAGHQISPNWNPKACDYFEQFDEEHNIQGQHARNGGEFYIKELGYWVDYINHDFKLIIEYDEKYHYDVYGNLKEKDAKRQEEIQNLYSDYEFVRIREDEIISN